MKKRMRKMYDYPVLVEYEDGYYIAHCPSFQGCVAQAPSYERALEEILEGIKTFIAIHKKKRWPLPHSSLPTMTIVKVAVNE
jgi:predicted RNase H-like HicB family nuclease